MPGEDTITMAQHELRRLYVIRKAIDKIITQKDASEVIGLSLRQVQRIVACVKKEGDNFKVHLTKPAQDGLANEQLVKLLAEFLHLKKYQVKVIKGHRTRNKLVEIDL